MAEAYDWARQTFPVSERSLQAALRLVLCGAVELSPDGTAQVWYHGQRSRTYFVDTQSCSCAAFTNTQGFCRHINARNIARYASELAQQYLADPTQVAMLHRDCPRPLAEQGAGRQLYRAAVLVTKQASAPHRHSAPEGPAPSGAFVCLAVSSLFAYRIKRIKGLECVRRGVPLLLVLH